MAEQPFSSLRLKNVRCYQDAEIQFHPQMTVIIGENGSGKSTIAESLASLTFGDEEGLRKFPGRRGAESGSIELFGDGCEPDAWWKVASDGSNERKRLPEDRWLFAYGRYRRVQFVEEFDEELADDRRISQTGPMASMHRLNQFAREATSRRTTTLNQPDTALVKDLSLNLIAIFEAAERDDRMQTIWQKLNDSVRLMKPELSGIEVIESAAGAYIPQVVRSDLALPINELSDGYQAILVIVLDLIMRLPMLFPLDDEPWNQRMVVVIDEVDLHLHVQWQRMVLRQLVTLFPGTQFVVTTHSPAVVQGAIDEEYAVILMKEHHGEAAPQPLSGRTCRELKGADLGSLIVDSKLFDVRSRYSATYDSEQQELEFLNAKVAQGIATEEDHARIFVISEMFENLAVDEEERRAEGFVGHISKINQDLMRDLIKGVGRARRKSSRKKSSGAKTTKKPKRKKDSTKKKTTQKKNANTTKRKKKSLTKKKKKKG